jgi:hypothetical protein
VLVLVLSEAVLVFDKGRNNRVNWFGHEYLRELLGTSKRRFAWFHNRARLLGDPPPRAPLRDLALCRPLRLSLLLFPAAEWVLALRVGF